MFKDEREIEPKSVSAEIDIRTKKINSIGKGKREQEKQYSNLISTNLKL